MRRAFIQLQAAVFLAGFTAILGKLISMGEGPLVVYRMWLSALALLVYIAFKKIPLRISLKQLVNVSMIGFVIAFHWLCFYGSVKFSNVSVAVVCLSLAGFFSSLLEPIVTSARWRPMESLLGLFSVAGVYIIFDFNPQFKLGILFGVFSSIGSALFPIFNKKVVDTFNVFTLNFYEMLGGAICLSVLMPFYAMLPFTKNMQFSWHGADWFWMLVLVLICTVYSYQLQFNALKKISAFTVNLMYNFEPIWSILFAFMFFDESKLLNWTFYLGAGLILLTAVIQVVRMRKLNN
jgi:drug/metabolite transporter (DMT)-like permease